MCVTGLVDQPHHTTTLCVWLECTTQPKVLFVVRRCCCCLMATNGHHVGVLTHCSCACHHTTHHMPHRCVWLCGMCCGVVGVVMAAGRGGTVVWMDQCVDGWAWWRQRNGVPEHTPHTKDVVWRDEVHKMVASMQHTHHCTTTIKKHRG